MVTPISNATTATITAKYLISIDKNNNNMLFERIPAMMMTTVLSTAPINRPKFETQLEMSCVVIS
jgi:hypothetical protein